MNTAQSVPAKLCLNHSHSDERNKTKTKKSFKIKIKIKDQYLIKKLKGQEPESGEITDVFKIKKVRINTQKICIQNTLTLRDIEMPSPGL